MGNANEKMGKGGKGSSMENLQKLERDELTLTQHDVIAPLPVQQTERDELTLTQHDVIAPPPVQQTERDELTLTQHDVIVPPPVQQTERDELTLTQHDVIVPPPVQQTERDELTLTQHDVIAPPPVQQTKRDELTLTQHDVIAPAVSTAVGMRRVLTQSDVIEEYHVPDTSTDYSGGFMKKVLTQDSFGTTAETLGSETKTISTPSDNGSMVDSISLPSLKSVLYAGNTKKGWTESNPLKPNQDAFLCQYDVQTASLIVACFDGHGQFGHDVSAYCKKYFASKLPTHPTFASDLHRSINETIQCLERDMLAAPEIDTVFSGSTLTMVVIRNMTVTVVNLGDSRIIGGVQLMSQSETDVAAIKVMPLSVDHKPEIPTEEARISSSGGRVKMVHGCGRVYLAKDDVPGLAMSRSLGDFVAHQAGVSSVPDVWDYSISDLLAVAGCAGKIRLSLMVATDGIYDMLSNEDAIMIAMKHFDDPIVAVDELLTTTDKAWRDKWNLVDDTSVCIVNMVKEL